MIALHTLCVPQAGAKYPSTEASPKRVQDVGHPLVAVEPAHAHLVTATLTIGALGLARPHPRIKQARRLPIRDDRAGRMQAHPALIFLSQVALLATAAPVEIPLRGTLKVEHQGMAAHKLDAMHQVPRRQRLSITAHQPQKTACQQSLDPAAQVAEPLMRSVGHLRFSVLKKCLFDPRPTIGHQWADIFRR